MFAPVYHAPQPATAAATAAIDQLQQMEPINHITHSGTELIASHIT